MKPGATTTPAPSTTPSARHRPPARRGGPPFRPRRPYRPSPPHRQSRPFRWRDPPPDRQRSPSRSYRHSLTLNSHQGRFREVRPPPPMPMHHARKEGSKGRLEGRSIHMRVADTRSQSRGRVAPAMLLASPLEKKGRREDRAPAGTHKKPHAN